MVLLALLSALGNGAASVLQRRAAMEQEQEHEREQGQGQGQERRGGRGSGWRAGQPLLRLVRLLRRPFWLAGGAAMVVSAVAQVGALAVGRLSVVQPLLVTELLFTLVVGSLVFRHRPDGRTWLAFVTLAAGLALFLVAADPSHGQSTAMNGRWLPVGLLTVLAVGALTAVARALRGPARALRGPARALRGPARAAVLGCATAACFACTAALIKEFTGRFSDGVAAVFTSWPLYAVCGVGLLSFLLLQSTLRAGTLAASQPALTLGDALMSIALGWVLFGERVALGPRIVPEAIGVALMAAGVVGLSRAPAVADGWDTATQATTARPAHPPRATRRTGSGSGGAS
ncbi:DMT family transporter [Streptomyces sp. ME19-01-6]|uniref:DMT family transporter n=1 Tax=Streptomyces sp. ME19-01-6 TaxID=3028686 RepID=UPI0029A512D7|nr:DMT family transporter [Streptomyces sp. ME19-01-6]MDX3229287.1 DMT family transporter [Streptomyces sp. ME19-01-6]